MGIYSNQSKKSKHSKFWVFETLGYIQALPSETLSLRWDDIDWEMNRMSIPEPKVEHHEGRGIRSCPVVPELHLILDEAFEIFGKCCGSLRGPRSWISEKATTLWQ
jgi:integrase